MLVLKPAVPVCRPLPPAHSVRPSDPKDPAPSPIPTDSSAQNSLGSFMGRKRRDPPPACMPVGPGFIPTHMPMPPRNLTLFVLNHTRVPHPERHGIPVWPTKKPPLRFSWNRLSPLLHNWLQVGHSGNSLCQFGAAFSTPCPVTNADVGRSFSLTLNLRPDEPPDSVGPAHWCAGHGQRRDWRSSGEPIGRSLPHAGPCCRPSVS